MAIFYKPPEPVQAVPKVLPRTPGSEPPRNGPLGGSSGALAAIGMWAAAAAVPMPTQKPLNVVALTLTYGAQPPRSGQLTGANDVAEMTATLLSWPQSGEPRLAPVMAAPSSAAWNVPPIAAQPPVTPYPLAVPAPSWQPPTPVAIAPLTLPYGQQPPRTSGPSQVAWPAPSWSQQAQPASAAWNVPVLITAQPFRAYPVTTWDTPFQFPQRLVGIAPLTLVYGQQPPTPPRAVRYDALWWSAQSAAPSAGWNVPVVVNNPPPVTPYPFAAVLQWGVTWPAQSEADAAAWNFIPPVVNTPPPRAVPPTVAVFAWQPPPPLPARPVVVAPLTLRYGTQPPPGPAFQIATAVAIAQQWPALWWPGQAAGPVAPLTLIYGQRPPVIGVRVPAAALLQWFVDWGTQRYPPVAAELAALLGFPPQQGINSIAFDALVTLVTFDTLTTATSSDSLATANASDSLTTSISFDSLTTTSAFDG